MSMPSTVDVILDTELAIFNLQIMYWENPNNMHHKLAKVCLVIRNQLKIQTAAAANIKMLRPF